MKTAALCLPVMLILAAISIGCADTNDTGVPPVLTAIDEMEAIDKAREEARMQARRDAANKQAEERKASGETEPAEESFGFPATGTYVVDFETTVGNYTIEVHREWAPRGANRFYRMVKDKFYDDAGFFRVVPGFMVQFGLAADPTMTAKWNGNIQDDPVIKSNTRGYVTFAKTNAPDSRSTQVFINYGDNARLDTMAFAPFGIVTKGMDVVDKISSAHGESPDQGKITSYGNEYLKPQFPGLDYIKTARIVVDDVMEPEPADPAIPPATESEAAE